MKKMIIALVIIAAVVLYAVKNSTASTTLPVTATPSTGTSGSSNGSSSGNGGYKDGVYTGSVADAYYGNIQVQATISGGKISNIQFLQFPNDRGRSVEINQQADPVLTQEALQAQNAQVDTVSGATDTSQAFMQSLQSALDAARS